MPDLLHRPLPPLLAVRLGPSMQLAAMLGFAHFSAIGLLWPLLLPGSVKLAGSAVLVTSLVFYLRRYALLRSPESITGLELSDEMICAVETRRGERIVCTLLGSSFVAPYLTVLELQPLKLDDVVDSPEPLRKFSFSVTVLPDGIDPEEFRQLRILLRWKWKDPKDLKDWT
ncbi:hypothetical protein [Nitrosospira briensis]|nr:hypothetical protein [Nitrosospira briensis]